MSQSALSVETHAILPEPLEVSIVLQTCLLLQVIDNRLHHKETQYKRD